MRRVARAAELRDVRSGVARAEVQQRVIEQSRHRGLVGIERILQLELGLEVVRWTWADVWTYIKVYEVPYNPLHDRQYPSIGCTHCTKPVNPGDDPRSGRWEGREKTECGLHKAS